MMQSASQMHVISVNVGVPREVIWKGRKVMTGIFKEPVGTKRVAIRRLNLAGDRQADLTVHGGIDKAVYAYPSEYYRYWREQFPDIALPWGMFGENLTITGLTEDTVHVGDRFQIGTAELMVTQPRVPCYKLGIKFGRDDILKRFLESGLTGFYLAVTKEGEVAQGDTISVISREEHQLSISTITRLYRQDKHNPEGLQQALQVKSLPSVWREYFQARLDKMASFK